jgi:hypothetical protein
MSKARTQIGIAALAILGFIGTAAAQGPSRREGGPGHRGPREGGPIERLDLTDQQRDQIQSIREKHRAENQPLFETARKAHQAFRKALSVVPLESVAFHAGRQDFSRWIHDVFQDRALARQMRIIEARWKRGDVHRLRDALARPVAAAMASFD